MFAALFLVLAIISARPLVAEMERNPMVAHKDVDRIKNTSGNFDVNLVPKLPQKQAFLYRRTVMVNFVSPYTIGTLLLMLSNSDPVLATKRKF